MPRHARLVFPGLPLHVIQRGNNRSACFHDEGGRRLYLALLAELSAAHGCDVHAYVLMDNHVHLLLTPRAIQSVAMLMKNLGQRYVQYVNRKHDRSGSLWEGRFRSSIVDSSAYLFTCQRYIELNPVRAGMVREPHEYSWSSHRANALGLVDRSLTPHELFRALGPTEEARRLCYRALFATPPSAREIEAIRRSVNGGFALGGDAFIEKLEHALGRRARRTGDRPLVLSRGTSGLSPVFNTV